MTALCTSLTTNVECITLENEAQRAKCEKEKQIRTSTYEKTLSQMMEDEKQLNESDSDRSQEENPMLKHLTEAFESRKKKIEKKLQPLIVEKDRLDAQNRDFLEKIELQFQAHVAALKADQPAREEVKKLQEHVAALKEDQSVREEVKKLQEHVAALKADQSVREEVKKLQEHVAAL